MLQKISKENSVILNCVRVFAVFSVICAHVKPIENNTGLMNVSFSILEIVGYGGVSLFFILSGFFMAYNQDSFLAFCKKKAINLLIPWLVTGTLVYMYSNVRKGSFTILGLLKNLAGSGSYLWYMSVLVVLYFLFFSLASTSCF